MSRCDSIAGATAASFVRSSRLAVWMSLSLVVTGVACRKDDPPAAVAPPIAAAPVAPKFDPCAVNAASSEQETINRLVNFDVARTAAFSPGIPLPEEPVLDPNENSFSREKKLSEYRASMAQVERQFVKYYEGFASEWNTASAGKIGGMLGEVPNRESCRVIDVSGGCTKKCLAIQLVGRRRGAVDPALPAYCEQDFRVEGVDLGWKNSCNAKVQCAVGTPLRITKPGLVYQSDRYELAISGVFGAAKKDTAAAIDVLFTETRRGDLLHVNGFKTWTWSEGTWRGAAIVDSNDNMPTLEKNEACRSAVVR